MKNYSKKTNFTEKRLNFIYKFVIPSARLVFKTFYNYKCSRPVDINNPVIVLANHVSDYDAILVASGFKRQMYFIASENCFRKGFKSKMLEWAFAPISKIKGASDTLAVMKAVRYLKEGKNICIFPEGGRTFNGRTTPVKIATGKLVKISGASLATFKISGGYLKIPRWGFGRRKGPWSGKVMGIYSAQELKNMTPQQITDIVNRDLYEDAYQNQTISPEKYKGKNLALGMECALCVCPECKTIGSIKSLGDEVYCTKCGLKTRVDEYGLFGKDFPFTNVAQWDDWQEAFYRDYTESIKDNNTAIVFDENVNLQTVDSNHQTVILGKGRFSLYRDRFSFKTDDTEINLPVEKIPDCSVFSRSNFNFTDSEGLHYELYADRLINVRKYLSVWTILREEKQ